MLLLSIVNCFSDCFRLIVYLFDEVAEFCRLLLFFIFISIPPAYLSSSYNISKNHQAISFDNNRLMQSTSISINSMRPWHVLIIIFCMLFVKWLHFKKKFLHSFYRLMWDDVFISICIMIFILCNQTISIF